MAKQTKTISYSAAMAEVDEILEKLNNEELDIDSLVKDVKQATELLSLCKNKLRSAESEITKLFE
ncbi:MAG: exodeoxyribonuclease VII small subunit [Rikenellaceae bacterium]